MQSSLAEKQDAEPVPVVPPVPIKTYQWEEVKRAKLQGAYPWTHILKEPLEGEEITAETILRDTSPRMSRDNSRERSGGRTPDSIFKDEPQKILNLDSSPGSSRKLDGEEETIHVPNFSKEISLDSEEDILEKKENTDVRAVTPEVFNLTKENKVSLSPKGILKRKLPERIRPVSEESPRNSKCCHPFVEKIKHIADKTIHKADRHSPKRGIQKKKILVDKQEILILDNSPGTERRKKLASEKEDVIASDKKISLVMEKEPLEKSANTETFEIEILDSSPSSKKRREHIYEDIENVNKLLNQDSLDNPNSVISEVNVDNQCETKSGDSQDPSLLFDEPMDEENVSESLNHVKAMYDISMTPDKLVADIQCNNVIVIEPNESASPNVCDDDVIVTTEVERRNESPNITITEVTEDGLSDRHLNLDDMDVCAQDRRVHFDMSDTNNKSDPEEETTPEEGNDNLWSKISDHEYEPVGKPPVEACDANNSGAMSVSVIAVAGETSVGAKSDEDPGWSADDASSTTSHERQFLHPPNEEDNEAFSGTENDTDNNNATSQHQKETEYFVNTPTTTESRTDCEISTSQVDSSAIEDLPLKRDSRKKSVVAQETAKLRQRLSTQTGKIKNHAGKIKTRLKTIKKPQFSMPERPKFNLPERPKFNLPSRPKFNMPERPKINLPERPKFKMPERPKINLPERPKINFPERPRFSLPDRPKFNFPDRPKINFPDRPKFTLPDRSKFKLPDKAKLNFSSFNRSKENRSSSIDDTVTTEPSVSSKKNFLDFDFRTYPRIFSKNKKKKEISGERPGTPPPPGFATVPRATNDRKQIVASQWEHASSRTTDDEPRHYGIDYSYDKEPDFQTKLAQVDKDYREMQKEVDDDIKGSDTPIRATLENKEIWNTIERNTVQQLEHRSSLPFLSTNNNNNADMFDDPRLCDDDESSAASSGKHRRGVLEEINNDEFFLRQKGISQDNIEVGKYLSNEIRDAFRSPVNALNQIDKDSRSLGSANMQMDIDDNEILTSGYKEDSEEQICHDEEEINQNNLMAENDDGYYTFPPVRPSRAKKLKTLVQELPKEKIAIAHDENEEEFAHIHLQSIPTPSIFSETQQRLESESNLENFQKRVFGSTFKEPEILENLNEYENEIEHTKEVPTIPKRRRRNPADRNHSECESLFNDNIEARDWVDPETSEIKNTNDEQIILYQVESTVPMSSNIAGTPVVPRRSRSRGSRTTSLGDDDRTSRGAESLTLDSHIQMNNVDLDYMDDLDDGPGYAIVDKTVQPKEEEMPPPRPPPPMRRHRSAKSLSGDRQFFTVPRSLKESSPPRRPSRNYSTLGPSRPPRKKSTTSLSGLESLQKTSLSGDVTQYVEIEDDDADSHKNLKSGEVVSKMKDRPLPPPPRPPRGPKKKKDATIADSANIGFSENIRSDTEIELSSDPTLTQQEQLEQNNMLTADTNNNTTELQDANALLEIEKRENNIPYEISDQEHVVEIEVSTQTDPLPDDFDYDLGIDEPLSETFDLRSSCNDLTKEEAEDNSIDVELMTKSLQKFRESSRPSSRSSKLKSPTDRPKTPLGRMSPTAILVERRVSSPTRINEREEFVTEASLTVQPIDEVMVEQRSFTPVHRYYPTASEVLHSMNVPHAIPDHSVQQSEQPKSIINEVSKRANTLASHEAGPINQELQAVLLPPSTPQSSNQIIQQINISDLEVLKTQRLQVGDLDVERLSVSELQASKILVSDIEGLSLNVNDVNSKSGHIYVRGIELAPGVIEELLEKFAQMVPPSTSTASKEESTQDKNVHSPIKSDINQETQTDEVKNGDVEMEVHSSQAHVIHEVPSQVESTEATPLRPPPPTIHPAMFQPIPYYPEFSLPSSSYYRHRPSADRRQDGGDGPPPPSRSRKHRRELSLSSSEDEDYKPVSRRIPSSHRAPEASEASVSELSIQLLRACQNSVSRTIQHIVSYIKKHFGDVQSKKEVEMAVVIFLVMAAGLIMLSLGDGRTVHHHHWDFINPSDGKR